MSVNDQTIDAGLLALEIRVGLAPKIDRESSDSNKDIASRLAALEGQWKSSTTTAFNQVCDESDKLLEELQPGAGLTYQQVLSGRSQNYPLLYRKQLVMSSQDSLRQDLKHLSNILNLLYISQKGTLKDVTQAPILSTPHVTPEMERRLDAMRVNLAQSQRQAAELADRMDSLITTYQKASVTLSDRIIRLEEKMTQQGK